MPVSNQNPELIQEKRMSQFDESNSLQNEVRDQNTLSGQVGPGATVLQGTGASLTQNFYQTAVTEREELELEPETILIPAGSFVMGMNKENIKVLIEKFGGDEELYKNETPEQEISLPAYRIGKFPVTNAQYKEFIDKTKGGQELIPPQTLITPGMGWDDSLNIPDGKDNFPVTGITWHQALAYCQWLSGKTKRNYQLPNEAQWEKACRGGMNYLFPWGDEFDGARCNQGRTDLAPIDPDKPSQNEYGVFDFVGNIRQWTCSLWGTNYLAPDPKYVYPWKNDRRNDENANSQIRRVVRGSSFTEERINLRCSIRRGELPESWVAGIGFRVAVIVE